MDTTLEPDSNWRVALRPLITTRGWTQLTHHLLGLPIGTTYFVWLVTGLSLGLGLVVTLLGIPILTLVLANVRPLLMAELALANALLGADLPAVAIAPGGDGWLGRLKAYWTDGTTWRGVVYLLLRFPVGIFTFTVALDAMDLGFWEPDTVIEGLALVPFGVVALFTAGWISEGMAVMSRALARWGTR